MAFLVKGKVVTLDARRLEVTGAFGVSFAGGEIADSTLRVAIGQDARFFRLDSLSFERVTWQLPADASWHGRRHPAQEPLQRHMHRDVHAQRLHGRRQRQCRPDHRQRVLGGRARKPRHADLRRLQHEPAFGTATLPQTIIAQVNERGTWTFHKADLGNRDPAHALPKSNHPDVHLDVI